MPQTMQAKRTKAIAGYQSALDGHKEKVKHYDRLNSERGRELLSVEVKKIYALTRHIIFTKAKLNH